MTDLRLNKKLPNKPSKLIEVALNDLGKTLKKDDEYKIDMSEFYVPNGKCSVCLAGSVMAERTNIKEVVEDSQKELDLTTGLSIIETDESSRSIASKLYAINNLRSGRVGFAFMNLGLEKDIGLEFSRNITPWRDDPTLFVIELYELSKDLRKAGY